MNDRWRSLALLLLRLAGLYLALGHGWGKVSSLASGGGDGFIGALDQMGLPAPAVFAWLSALAEFGGGLLVAAGLFTRVAAGFATINMAVAVFLRHHAITQWWSALTRQTLAEDTRRAWGSPELACMFLLIMLALALLGPGPWSLDAKLRKKS